MNVPLRTCITMCKGRNGWQSLLFKNSWHFSRWEFQVTLLRPPNELIGLNKIKVSVDSEIHSCNIMINNHTWNLMTINYQLGNEKKKNHFTKSIMITFTKLVINILPIL
jgi:hypothetical protein